MTLYRNLFLYYFLLIFRYDSKTNKPSKVDYPTDEAMIFDVETLVLNKNCPVLAVAASRDAWLLIRNIIFFFKQKYQLNLYGLIWNKIGILGVASGWFRTISCTWRNLSLETWYRSSRQKPVSESKSGLWLATMSDSTGPTSENNTFSK
jgi:hypothetical protein